MQPVSVVYAAGESCFATIDGVTVYSSTDADAVQEDLAILADKAGQSHADLVVTVRNGTLGALKRTRPAAISAR